MGLFDKIFGSRKRRDEDLARAVINTVPYIDSMRVYRKYAFIILGREEERWISIREWKNIIDKGHWRIDDSEFLKIVDQFERAGCLRTDRQLDPAGAKHLIPKGRTVTISEFQNYIRGLVSSEPLSYSNKVMVTQIGSRIYALIGTAGAGVASQMGIPQNLINTVLQWEKEMDQELSNKRVPEPEEREKISDDPFIDLLLQFKKEDDQQGRIKDKPIILLDGTFENEVISSDILTLVEFWAEWCGPCKVVAPIIEELAKEYQGRVKFGKLDVDHNQQVAKKYGIRGIPALFIFKDGKVIDQIIGAVPKPLIVTKLNKLL